MRAVLAALMLCAAVTGASAQSAATVRACFDDAKGLCGWPMMLRAMGGNHAEIKSCFRAHWGAVSAGCKAAIGHERKGKR